MLCAELEQLEAQLNEIIAALENPSLTEQQRQALEEAYAQMSHIIGDHQKSGHDGAPCFEE
jgi:exonuclease VII small subunit